LLAHIWRALKVWVKRRHCELETLPMNSHKPLKFAIRGLALAALLTGCSSSDMNGNTGSGGSTSTGTGGTSSTGTGGSPSTGTGGTTSTGTGGAIATGGSLGTGTGGTASTGGSTGTGGVANTGGTAGSGAAGSGGHAGGGGRAGAAGGGGHPATGSGGSSGSAGSSGGAFALTSMHQMDAAKFDSKYTCQESPPLSGKQVGGLGNGVNPDLEWTNAPAGTMSFAITFLDTTLIDAKMDSLGNHWAIWNIPATVMSLPEATTSLTGDLAAAKQSGTFLAPCAQSLMNSMDDQYAFTIYALSTSTLNVSGTGVANARTALSTAMTAGQVLGTAVLHGHAGLKGM